LFEAAKLRTRHGALARAGLYRLENRSTSPILIPLDEESMNAPAAAEFIPWAPSAGVMGVILQQPSSG
jgi:hypothetical protein